MGLDKCKQNIFMKYKMKTKPWGRTDQTWGQITKQIWGGLTKFWVQISQKLRDGLTGTVRFGNGLTGTHVNIRELLTSCTKN